jgi:small-conductance mechanosensitive channel
LLVDRAALLRKIARCDRDLRNVHWIFWAGLFGLFVGVLLLWLAVSNTTLYTIGNTRYVADPIFFGMVGVIFCFLGFGGLFGAVYVRIFYPSKLEKLRQSLRDLDDLLLHRKVFSPQFRRELGSDYHVHYEDYVKEVKRVRSLKSAEELYNSYAWAGCLLAVGIFTMAKAALDGYPFEGLVVGGTIALLGAIWAFWKYRRNKR